VVLSRTFSKHLAGLGVVWRSAVAPLGVFVAEDGIGVGEVVGQGW
jgi:hypothetical protein